MTPADAGTLITLMLAALPGVRMPADEITATAKVWAKLFGKWDYATMERAALKALETHKYHSLPTPAEIRDALMSIVTEQEPSALEAWDQVVNAFWKFGYTDESGALGSMTPRAAFVVQRMGWYEMCTDSGPIGVMRGQFIKLYDASKATTPDVKALPRRRDGLTAVEAREVLGVIEGGVR